MFKTTFKGGIHTKDQKGSTINKAIVELPQPKIVIIPLLQHYDNICTALVKVGDQVSAGQKIGDCPDIFSAPVHAPISGMVKSIDKYPHPLGTTIDAIVIENDGENKNTNTSNPNTNIDNLSKEDIIKAVREAGIVGLGGATFPTHIKLNPPKDKTIDTIIINGCECEPYATCDYRLMIEQPDKIISGINIVRKLIPAGNIYIGVEDNKPDAISALQKISGDIKVIPLKTKYPQGGEKMLIKAITKREVPSGGLPHDVGVSVFNVGTIAAIHDALMGKKPLTKRVVTVTGSGINQPQNVLAYIGTPIEEVLDFCGGLKEDINKVIMGGPMMGWPQHNLSAPVIKATTALLCLTADETKILKIYPCIKCGKCMDNCPTYLMPTRIASFAQFEKCDEFIEYGGKDCIECGGCAYGCPSHIPLVQFIKLGKLKFKK
ncbi:MAG: electron transport complex subunit RsxC [bacterium]